MSSPRCLLALLVVLDLIDDLFGETEIFDLEDVSGVRLQHRWPSTHVAPSNIALLELVELVALGSSLNDVAKNEVHPCIAVDKVSVYRLSVLEFDKNRMTLGGGKQA